MRLGNHTYQVLVGQLRHTERAYYFFANHIYGIWWVGYGEPMECAYYFYFFSPHDGFLPVNSSRYFAVRFISALSLLFDLCFAESSAA